MSLIVTFRKKAWSKKQIKIFYAVLHFKWALRVSVDRGCLLTCLSRMKSCFAFVTVLENLTLILWLDWGTFFNLYLWLGLFSEDFKIFSLPIKILTLLI